MDKDSSKRFVLPPGWDSKEDVAAQMGCSEDRVRVNLAPAIKEGRIEVKVFPVWSNERKRKEMVTAYRETKPNAKKQPPVAA